MGDVTNYAYDNNGNRILASDSLQNKTTYAYKYRGKEETFSMASLGHLDLLLGEALECIVKASSEVRGIDKIGAEEALKHFGKAITELWHVRETIYRLKPELKRDFVREYEEGKVRYEELTELLERASQAEGNSNFKAAMKLYQELRQTSRFGYFRMMAEAALYRLSTTPLSSSSNEGP
jgi:hypothetical protein